MLHRCFDWNGKCAGQRICYVSITRMSRHVCVCNVYISSKRTMAGGGVYARVHARNETPPGATQRHLSAHLQTHHQQLSSAKHLLKHQIFNVNALLIWWGLWSRICPSGFDKWDVREIFPGVSRHLSARFQRWQFNITVNISESLPLKWGFICKACVLHAWSPPHTWMPITIAVRPVGVGESDYVQPPYQRVVCEFPCQY